MIAHPVIVEGRRVTCLDRRVVQYGVNADELSFDLDSEWDGLSVTVVLSHRGESTAIPFDGSDVPIPSGMMLETGPLYVSLLGRDGKEVVVTTERMDLPLVVVESEGGSGGSGGGLVCQVRKAVEEARDATTDALEAARYARSAPRISCGSGSPALGSSSGDLYIDYAGGSLYEFEEIGD